METARSEVEATRTTLQTQLAESERDMTAIRRKRDEHAVNLEQAQQRIHTLEQAVEEAGRRQQLADAHLEEQGRRRTLATAQLDAARQEILVANAAAESCRLASHLAAERVSTLEQRLEELETAAQACTTVLKDGHHGGLLEQSLEALITLGRATHDEILSMLIEHINRLYRAVVVFATTPDGLRVWKSGAELPTPRIPAMDGKSPVALAYKQCTIVTATAASVADSDKLWDGPVGSAIALPIMAFGRVLAVAYAENRPVHWMKSHACSTRSRRRSSSVSTNV